MEAMFALVESPKSVIQGVLSGPMSTCHQLGLRALAGPMHTCNQFWGASAAEPQLLQLSLDSAQLNSAHEHLWCGQRARLALG